MCTLNSVTSNRISKCSRSKRQNTHKYEGKFRVEGLESAVLILGTASAMFSEADLAFGGFW